MAMGDIMFLVKKMESRVIYHRKKKKKKTLKKINFLLLLFFFCVFCVCSYKLFCWNNDNSNIKKINNDASEFVSERKADGENINPPNNKEDDYFKYIKMDMLNANFNELLKINSDTVGFIKVNGTNINYPVVQTDDNDYYLTHAYDKSKNSAGWVFADFRNDMKNFDKNTIIYAHGRLNNTMFGSLKGILNSKWYDNKNNYVVKFSTPYENTLWQVFSVYSIKAESYYITTSFGDDYGDFLKTIKNRSLKDFNTDVSTNDKVLTLSTCKDTSGKERVVMHAKLIKIEKR